MNVALPVLDMRQDLATLGQGLDKACRTLGLCYLTQHGIASAVVEDCFTQAQKFFALPVAQKATIARKQSAHNRGWYHYGEEVLDYQNYPKGDYKEGIKIGNDLPATHRLVQAGTPLHGANQWPDETALQLAGWKQAMQKMFAECRSLAEHILQALSVGLGLQKNYFDKWVREPMATLSPLCYPPESAGEISAAPHTDFGCLTLLWQKQLAGLEVHTPQGWQKVPVREDAVVLNIGEMMAHWTNDTYHAPTHRVRNRHNAKRYSVAFFFDPQADTPLQVLPQFLPNGAQAHYAPTTALAHLQSKIAESTGAQE